MSNEVQDEQPEADENRTLVRARGRALNERPPAGLARVLPFLRWFPLERGALRADVIAGVTVALLLIPQAMAYAQLAGLPPYHGLCAAFIPVMVAALFGWSNHLHTGPVALTALMTGAVLTDLGATPGSPDFIRLAAVLALMVGAIRLALGLLRLSSLMNLVSHPVVVAFTGAGAIIIALSQLHVLLGVPAVHGGNFLADVAGVVGQCNRLHVPTVLMSGACLVLLLLLKRFAPRWPGALTVMVAGIVVSGLTGFEKNFGGAVVGTIPAGLPDADLPGAGWAEIGLLIPGALVTAVVGFMEALSITKTLAARTRDRVNLDQELVGQGLAALSAGLFQSFPVSGSFSRSALNLYVGARSGLASVISGLVVMGVLLCLTPLLYHLPQAVFGVLIVVSVMGLVDLRVFGRLWRVRRRDGLVAWVTFVVCLALAPKIVDGIFVGAALSIVFHLHQMMRPHVAVLARHPDGTLKDVERHGLSVDPRILAVRFDGRLIFANASYFEECVLAVRAEHPGARAFLLVAEGINELDASGEDILRRIVEELRGAGLEVVFTRVKGRMMDILKRSGLHALIGESNIIASPDRAWSELVNRLDAAG